MVIQGKLGVLDGVRVGLQLLAVLRHLHLVSYPINCLTYRSLQYSIQAGWIHRDVKPSNMCIGYKDKSRVMLIDFGACRTFVHAGKVYL